MMNVIFFCLENLGLSVFLKFGDNKLHFINGRSVVSSRLQAERLKVSKYLRNVVIKALIA